MNKHCHGCIHYSKIQSQANTKAKLAGWCVAKGAPVDVGWCKTHDKKVTKQEGNKPRASRGYVAKYSPFSDGERTVDLPMDYPVKSVFVGGVNPWTGGVV